MISKPRSLKHVIPAFGLALVVSLAFAGIGAGSASAAQAWYSCMEEGEGYGLFEDSACSKEGGTKEYAWYELDNTPTGFAMKNLTNFTLELQSFTTITINCSSQGGNGTIENHEAGGTTFGILSEPTFTLSGCTVSSPKGCTVTSPLTILPLSAETTEFEGKPAVKFTPLNANAELTTFTVSNCGILNGVKTVKGSLTGIANNSSSSLEFTAKSSAVVYGSKKAPFFGNSKMETGYGEALKLAP